jgi:Bacterial PH domain
VIYKPKKAYGGWVGLFTGMALFGFMIWGIGYGLDENDRTLQILLLAPIYIFLAGYLYALIGAFNMNYRIESDALVIRWALQKKRIAWDQVTDIIQVKGQANLYPYLGVSWPGYMFGLYSAKGLGSVRMYASHTEEGFIFIKTEKGYYGITPADQGMLTTMLDKSGKTLETIDMDQMSREEKGEGIYEDRTFLLYYRLNYSFLLIFAAYLGVFFPGSGASKFLIILLVMALALYIFNVGNAKRIYQFSAHGAYLTLLMQLMVTGMFIILAIFGIGLG